MPVKDTSYFEHTRPEVVALIPVTARRVLDIGCAAGRLGAHLKERQAAEVVGIELNPEAAALARRRLDQVMEQNIEDPAFDFAAARFDCVVCADVLEHLREPALVLAKIRRWLTPDGVLVASLPNVRHHSVVSSLLEGNWTYEAAGLLDNDHVRFFTRREIEKLLYRQGFEIEVMQAKPGPGYEEWSAAGRPGDVRVGSLNISGMTSDDAQEFFTYQYLVVVRPILPPLARGHSSFPPLARGGQGGSCPAQVKSQAELLEKLACDYPWPAEKPRVPVPTEKLGWFKEPQQELIRRELNETTKLVVELGAWLGLSTRFIADQAPHARVITIDHWQGSSEHQKDPACAAMLPTLFETFTALNWEYRDRMLPLKMTIREGLQTIADYGLKPDVIFIDAEHTYQAVSADLNLSRQLFPQARLIGDDYDSPDVQRAVDEFAASHGFQVEPVGTGWRSWRLLKNLSTSAPAVDATSASENQPAPAAPSSTSHPPSSILHPRSSSSSLTSIIIVTHNQLAYTRECVDSIRLRTDEPYELIFIDNGSTDGTVEYLRSVVGWTSVHTSHESRGLKSTLLIENPDNRGFPAAVNQGLQIARGEFVLLLNNDTVVTTGWLRRMRDVLQSDPRIGLVGPCSNCVSGAQLVAAGYQNMASLDGFAWDWAKRHEGVVEDADRLIGFCLGVKRAVIDQIGLFDERFGIGCFEDDDFCLRALQAGWRAVIARDTFIHHYGNRTFQGSGIDLGNVLDVNRQKFLDKWTSTPPLSKGALLLPPLSKGGPGGVAPANGEPAFSPETQPSAIKDLSVVSCPLSVAKSEIPLPIFARAPRSQTLLGNEEITYESTPGHQFSSNRCASGARHPPSSILHPRPSLYHVVCSPTGGLLLQLNMQADGVTPLSSGDAPAADAPVSILHPPPSILHRLSLCMIVRDNETTIGPCLESIRPYVDEIIVVDTGSKDRTSEICRQYGARLFEFPWCDDFSAARNESLKHARGEWIFWMDSDDTISPECGQKLRALVDQLAANASEKHGVVTQRANAPGSLNLNCRSEIPNPKSDIPNEPVLGYVMQVHCPGPGQEGRHDVTVVDHVKLIRNRPDLRFEGRIHEQLLPSIRRAGGDVVWTDIHVVHSGSDHSPAGWQRKLERDLRILHLELEERPDHPFVLFNLGMTYADAANHFPPLGREHNSFPPLGRGGQGGSRCPPADSTLSREAEPSAMIKLAVDSSQLSVVNSEISIVPPPSNCREMAIAFLAKCMAVSVPEESHVRKAFALLVSSLSQAERHEQAWIACRNGLDLYPDDKELLFRSAMLHHHFGRLREAEEAYLQVLNGHEERHFSSIDHGLAGYKARYNLAIVYEDMGRLAHAETEWRRIVRDVPDYSPARRGLGENLVRQGKLAEGARLMNV